MSALAIRRFPERITRRRQGTATFNLYGEPESGAMVETVLAASVQPLKLSDADIAGGVSLVERLQVYVRESDALTAGVRGSASGYRSGRRQVLRCRGVPVLAGPALPRDDLEGDLAMRWPWRKPETRESGGDFSDAVVRLIEAQAAAAAARGRDPPARLAPPRGRAWPGAGRRVDVREDVSAVPNHRSQGRRHDADSHGTPAPARAPFSSICSSRGLDDNRYVVERYKSTFDGEIVRWPCKGKSKTGKQPRQVMSLGAVQRMRPERDEIIVCSGVKITGSGIQYWGSAATGLFGGAPGARGAKRLAPGDAPPAEGAAGGRGVLRPDFNRGREEHAIQRPR